MNQKIKSILSSATGISMVIACIWLVKFFTINVSEWKGSTEDMLYAYRYMLGICVSVIVIGVFVQMQGRDD